MKNRLLICLSLLCLTLTVSATPVDSLETGFKNPPGSARPWVFWFWINGNVSKEGITADLEALHRVGVGGLIWMEVSGTQWAPEGGVTTLSPQWHDCMQWTVRECARLGLEFDLSVAPGYGSGGPWITPETSMQELVWSEQTVEGGKGVPITLEKPKVKKSVSAKQGCQISQGAIDQIKNSDSYKDVAVLAVRLPASPEARAYRIAEIIKKSGLSNDLPPDDQSVQKPPADAVTPVQDVIDLTGKMDRNGLLAWEPPSGSWLLMRFGHASNLKLTRPCPESAMGLECDRLATAGIDAHFAGFLKKTFTDAGAVAGKTLNYVHIDSWEAGGQNWTATFPSEFLQRRGYDLRPWLPVLAGRVVGSAELSERFLWDVRMTVSEMIRDNYANRLRELARPYGMKFSCEPYGKLCIDNLSYAGVSDLPISEFWTKGNNQFPKPSSMYEASTKAMTSAAHTYGKPVVGAEAFTGARKWDDHPFLLKAMGDQKFCEGLNRMIFHCSVHQPYDNMVPGLTHQKWGEHFDRFNTWWDFSGAWIDYLSRCQFLLQQGEFVADLCYWIGEGAPLSVDDMTLKMPDGYAFDFCSSEIVLQMKVQDGRIVLPSGMSYRYLLLPDTDRMTLPLATKIRELVDAGARVIGGKPPVGAPGLTGYPQSDDAVRKMAAELWDTGRVLSGKGLDEVFKMDGLRPDFEGQGLKYIHRRVGDAEVYFVSHQQNDAQEIACTFRVSGKVPELWNPETGAIRELPDFSEKEGRVTVPLHFDPMQSWFVVFRAQTADRASRTAGNFPEWKPVMELTGPWQVSFDPKWGGPEKPVVFEKLADWSKQADAKVKYYSGTAVYRQSFDLPISDLGSLTSVFLNFGKVEVLARVKVNGKDCGIAWKPPYRVDITSAARVGKNEMEIEVVNLWSNRMIGDEQLPEDSRWQDGTLLEWPDWFKEGKPSPSGRYTFTSWRHYKKISPLVASGLIGPVTLSTVQHIELQGSFCGIETND